MKESRSRVGISGVAGGGGVEEGMRVAGYA